MAGQNDYTDFMKPFKELDEREMNRLKAKLKQRSQAIRREEVEHADLSAKEYHTYKHNGQRRV